ncbi:hypothetical protein H7Y21_00965 [Arenimonas sp.]|nr:hypothetical protein [Candidatus Parcubacteria bacterium]
MNSKYTFVGLANGMAFYVSKALSCRRHDLHLLAESNMNELISALTWLMIYGDSAYHEMDSLTSASEG